MVYLTMLSVAQTTGLYRRMIGRLIKHEVDRMLKGAFVIYDLGILLERLRKIR
jgi:hypothetical protein